MLRNERTRAAARCKSMGQAGETMSNEKEEIKCPTCIFRAWPGTGGKPSYSCEYILLTGKVRGCSVENCVKYIKATPELEKLIENAGKAKVKEQEVWPLAFLADGMEGGQTPAVPQPQKNAKQEPKKPALSLDELRARDEEQVRKKKAANQKYYRNHKTQMREKKKEWYRNNRERALEYDKEYHRRKKEVSGKSEV